MRGRRNTLADFWAKKDNSGPPHPYNPELGHCWIWPGRPCSQGYGQFRLDGKLWRVHVLALVATTGSYPSDKAALHSCDRPICWNPEHLRWGTSADNTKDMIDRGRGRNGDIKGEDHGNSKLTERDVIEIHMLLLGGMTQRDAASRFGISQRQVGRIASRKSWNHVDLCDNFEWLLERLTKELEACETKRHEDTPNTLCSDRECCPLSDGVQRPVQDAGAGVRSDSPLFDSYVRRLPS